MIRGRSECHDALFFGVIMKNSVIRKKIIDLVSKEISQGNQFIDNRQLVGIKRKLSGNESLSMDVRRDLADYVVGQRIGESDGHEYEELIDWLLYQGN
mgnify:CR=1 FL=1